MNIETLNKAKELTKQIKENEDALFALKHEVELRKRSINEYKNGRTRWIPFENWFCKGDIKNNKVTVDAPMECKHSLEFELDEECIDLIINYEMQKIEKLKRELEEL
jgi:hypothetical protein